MSDNWPNTIAAWAKLNDELRRCLAQLFLGWALKAHTDEVVDTVVAALEVVRAPS